MESSYGVGINNRYALFIDEEGEENEDALIKNAAKVAVKAPAPVVAEPKANEKPKPGNNNDKKPLNNRNKREGRNGYQSFRCPLSPVTTLVFSAHISGLET